MGVIVLFGALAHFVPRFQRSMHQRLRIAGPLRKYLYTGVSVGELVLLSLVTGLFAWWLYFWRWDYDRIAKEADPRPGYPASCCPNSTVTAEGCTLPADKHGELQVWARVMGHMTTLAMSFLILPAARNSVWEYVFGVPFERAVKVSQELIDGGMGGGRGMDGIGYLF